MNKMPWTLQTEQQLQLKWEKLPYKIKKAHNSLKLYTCLIFLPFCETPDRHRQQPRVTRSGMSLCSGRPACSSNTDTGYSVFRMRASPHLYSIHTHTCRYCSTTNFYHTLTMHHCHSFLWITFQLRFVLILFWHAIKASAMAWEVRYHGDSYLAP